MATTQPPGTGPTDSVVGRVVGAAFLLVLFVVPIDMMTMALWVIGLVVAGSAFAPLVRAVRRRSLPLAAACLAALVLFPASCAMQFKAMGIAMRRVDELAEEAQRRCTSDGICPDVVALCGGTVDPRRTGPDGFVAGQCGTAGTTVRFPIHYTVRDGGRRFSVSTRLNIDESVSSRGGVGLPLERSHLLDGVDLAAPDPVTAAPTPAPSP